MASIVTELDVINNNHESIWITIGNHTAKLKVGVIYMPSENTIKNIIKEAYNEIEDEVKKLKEMRILLYAEILMPN